jgi:hypothetical protein
VKNEICSKVYLTSIINNYAKKMLCAQLSNKLRKCSEGKSAKYKQRLHFPTMNSGGLHGFALFPNKIGKLLLHLRFVLEYRWSQLENLLVAYKNCESDISKEKQFNAYLDKAIECFHKCAKIAEEEVLDSKNCLGILTD